MRGANALGEQGLHFHVHILPRIKGVELMLNWGLRRGEINAIKHLAAGISGQM